MIGPQEKHRNLRRDKDSKDFFHEVLSLIKIPPKLVWKEAFHRVHSFDSKCFVGKFSIGIKSSKISMNFLSIKGTLKFYLIRILNRLSF